MYVIPSSRPTYFYWADRTLTSESGIQVEDDISLDDAVNTWANQDTPGMSDCVVIATI